MHHQAVKSSFKLHHSTLDNSMIVKVLLVCFFAIALAQEEDPPQPYHFNYDSTDELGNRLTQTETGDEANRKVGTYGFQTADGTFRKVDYVADENGFRATVDTNEPGTKAENPADVQLNANPRPNPVVAPVSAPLVARPAAAALHLVAAPQPVAVHAVHAVSPQHVPVTYTVGRASSR
ncbi:cuticle protein 16.8-like [Ornithodoros turicata]|uniref:cuticle protein 16.8-like n=1 Tax=Ornithodoros turicata TaxID=34597 RepID=UPI003139D639